MSTHNAFNVVISEPFFRVDPAELFSCETEKKEATAKLRMPHFLAQESKGCDCIVLWLDCDKVRMLHIY